MTGEQEGVTRLPANAGKDQDPVPDYMLRDGAVVFNEWADFAADVLKGGKEGSAWIGLEHDYYLKPKVDAKLVSNVLKNNYVTEQIERLRRLLFIDQPVYRVLDVELPMDDAEATDEELTDRLTEMFTARDVRMWRCMQQAWVDIYGWGCSLWNIVWVREGGRAAIARMRRLPPESFAHQALNDQGKIYSPILKGITLDKDGETILYWQRQSDNAAPVQVKNVWMVKDPISTELAGTSKIVPLVPIIEALNFCMKAQMQYVNRTGAPIAWIKITSPVKSAQRDDFALAKRIIKNWGKDTGYTLPDNMELVVIDIKGKGNPLDTLIYYEKRIKAYISPATLIATEGPTLGEGTGAKLDLVHEWIKGEHNWVEGEFEEIGDAWLGYNSHTDRRVDIEIPEPTPDSTDTDMKRAEAGHRTGSMTKDEIRGNLGLDPLTVEARAQLIEEATIAPPVSPFGFPASEPRMDAARFQGEPYVEDPQLTVDLAQAAKRAPDAVHAAYEAELKALRDERDDLQEELED